MENYKDIHKTICRICLKYGNKKNMISLIDINAKDGLSCYGKAVITFADIRIENQDSLPAVMCEKCLHLLKQAIYFKLLCESSDKRLKNLLTIVGNRRASLQEKLGEYTMFGFYFPEILKSSNPRKRKKSIQTKTERIKIIKSKNIELPIEFEVKNESVSEDFGPSDLENNIDNDDELLNKMQKLIDSNITGDIAVIRPLKRKKVGLKKKTGKRKKNSAAKSMKDAQEFICNVCNKVLANHHTYKHHMQRHNGCRFICEQCGKGFPIRTELNIHQVTRHGTGPYLQCSQCPFKAPRRFDLTEHERIHTGERPYACEKCGLTFRRRGIWRKHLLYHLEKTVQCPQCPRKFFQRSEMLTHANNVHERRYMYLCSKCGATYAKPATVRRHMTERHAIPREMQGKIIKINKGSECHEQSFQTMQFQQD